MRVSIWLYLTLNLGIACVGCTAQQQQQTQTEAKQATLIPQVMAKLVAVDVEQYVKICLDLARDLPRLSRLRATLRERMEKSPLMDAPRFARNLEAAYREMWQRWCAK